MKKIFLILFLIPSFCFSQLKTVKNLGLDPATGEPGYVNLDTFRTIYYHSPLYTIGDTVYSDTTGTGGSGVWSLNGTKAYYLGYAGLGTNDPRSRFEIQTSYNTTTAIDSLGLILSQSNPATNVLQKASPPLIWEAPGWNTATSASLLSRFRVYTQGASGSGGATPTVYFQVAKDTSNYVTPISFTGGTTTQFGGVILGTSGTFTSTITANGLISAGNNVLNSGGTKQTIVGNNIANPSIPIEPSAIFAMYGSGKQGFLPPIMTQAQRDSIGYTVSDVTITNGGSGYTSAPNVTNTQTYLNSSAPATNGAQSWGGNFFMGTATISGGAVTGVTITHGGYFNGAIKINFVGGGGTGAAATATMSRLLPPFLRIACSDCTADDGSTGVMQTWQESTSSWKNDW